VKPISSDTAFFQSLYEFDFDLFRQEKAKGCSRCQGPLDTSNYQRKPRGPGEEHTLRFSLCCRRKGCRKRTMPPSIRFFGRRVYTLWVCLLAIDFAEQLEPRQNILRQTLRRWRLFWQVRLAETSPFMQWARGFLQPGWPVTSTPESLIKAFSFTGPTSWIPVLKFFIQLS
jgi:hypothetical protein